LSLINQEDQWGSVPGYDRKTKKASGKSVRRAETSKKGAKKGADKSQYQNRLIWSVLIFSTGALILSMIVL